MARNYKQETFWILVSKGKHNSKIEFYPDKIIIKGNLTKCAKLFLDDLFTYGAPYPEFELQMGNNIVFKYKTFSFCEEYNFSPRFLEFKNTLDKMLLLY